MKKVFAALAASAVAVSMLAFAGCGNPKGDEGAIAGDYEEKTPEQVTEIVDKIDTDKIFGDMEAEGSAVNMGVKVNLSGGLNMADMLTASGSLKLDYKMTADENDAAGVGSVELSANYMSLMGETKQEDEINFSGSLYNNTEWVYAATDDGKVKINMSQIMEEIGGNSDENITPSPMAFLAADEEDTISLTTLLAMAQEFGVKVAIDDKDGVKIKLSATQETVWKAVAAIGAEEGITEEVIAQMKESVTFNTFKFDVYFAIDAQGAFSGASVVMDIDVKMPMITAGAPTADASAAAPSITANVKGSIEIYTHGDTVTVPSTVTGDTAYADMTETVIAMIKNAM